MGSVKIANGKITLCAKRGKAITFVCNWIFFKKYGLTSRGVLQNARLMVALLKKPFGEVGGRFAKRPYSIRRNRYTRKSRNSAFSHVKRRRFCIFAKLFE
ncbi:MAG: hypothetical protein ACI3ZA_06050 [Alloprevotella sp.]